MSLHTEIPKGYVLSSDGLVEERYKYVLNYDMEPLEHNHNIQKASEWLRENVVYSPRKHIASYDGKHVYERITKHYVTNGEFIAAMRLAGFHSMRIFKGTVNVNFCAWWDRDAKDEKD